MTVDSTCPTWSHRVRNQHTPNKHKSQTLEPQKANSVDNVSEEVLSVVCVRVCGRRLPDSSDLIRAALVSTSAAEGKMEESAEYKCVCVVACLCEYHCR